MVRRSNWTFARWGVAFLVGTAAVLILSHCLSSPAAGGGVEGSGGVAFEMASVRSTAPLTFTPVSTSYIPMAIVRRPSASGCQTDDFSDSNSGWPTGYQPDGTFLTITGGEYHIYPIGFGDRFFNGWSASEFQLSVEGWGEDGYYGLVFGQNQDTDIFEFYFFQINSTDGTYRLERWAPNPDDVFTWNGSSDAIHPGTETNELMVEREAGWITLYVNGEEVERVYDTMFTGDRLVGLGTFDIGEVHFDNFTLCEVSRSP
jgi:hypothetical protein